MKDETANRPETPGTQRRGEWSPQENEKLKQIAAGKPRAQQLREMFPGRSLGAIKVHLHHIRRELGLPKRGMTSNLRCVELSTTMLAPDDPGVFAPHWLEAQRPRYAQANASYLAALQAAA
jgi:hypothetical protein